MSKHLKLIANLVFLVILAQIRPGLASANVLGEKHTFFVNSAYNASGQTSVAATLNYVGERAYFYVEDSYLNGLGVNERQQFDQQVVSASQEFDNNIYPKEINFWGSEPNPGIDNDPKITILLERLTSGTGGYFDSVNEYPSSQVKNTNQREIISANVLSLGSSRLKIFLAHEFQHLISFNQKDVLRNVYEDTWLNELRSQYAITVAGYNGDYPVSDLSQRVQSYLYAPEDSLTEWPNTNLDYASVTLFGQYLIDRFGPTILQESLHSSLVGIDSINKYLRDHKSSENFTDLFSDWVWTNYINNRSVDSRFGYLNQDLQYLHVLPTDSRQIFSQNTNSFSYSLKPWEAGWYQFRPDFNAPAERNIKISWVGPEFNVYYADLSGVKYRLNSGDIIEKPAGNFLLIPVNKSKVTNFGGKEDVSPLALYIEYVDKPAMPAVPILKDGDLIVHAGTPDTYVIWGTYKRYLAPEVLKFYGLDPVNAITVPEAVFQSYMPSNYVRSADEKKVYAVWPDETKHWLNISAQQFTDSNRDWNSIFIINNLESNFYKLSSPITK
ncbi:MAG: hypothetical protein KBC81_03545 [Candidatus Pacebacteria bacterium]|nr:hypothetical protein [Candidatus Paceibacterota bacterium]